MTDANVERVGRIDTATLSDALDKLGISGQCLGIKPLDHRFRLAGRAFTVTYAPAGPGGTVGDFIDDVPEGHVVLIDNGGRPDATVWGDIMTACGHQRKLGGTVIDGACRDTHLALDLGWSTSAMRASARAIWCAAIPTAWWSSRRRVRPRCSTSPRASRWWKAGFVS